LLVSGYIGSLWLGVMIAFLIAAVLLARINLLPKVGVWLRWTGFITKAPEVLRLAAATIGTYLLAISVLSLPGQSPALNGIPGVFKAELVSLGLGLFLMVVLLPAQTDSTGYNAQMERQEGAESGLPASVRSAVRIVLALAFFLLLADRRVYAKMCADPSCCCDGSANLCALATSGFLPFLAPKKRKRKDCSGLQRAYQEAKSRLDTLDAKIKDLVNKFNDDASKLRSLDNQSNLVKDEAMSELREIAVLEAGSLVFSAIADIVASLLVEAGTVEPIDPIATYIYTGPAEMSEGVKVLPLSFGFDAVEKFGKMYSLWSSQSQGLNTGAYRELANEWQGYPGIGNAEALLTLCRLLDDMNSLLAKMDLLMDRYDELLVERADLAKKVAAAKAAWEECLRKNR